MLHFLSIFVIIRLVIVCSAVYYALKSLNINHSQLIWELKREMETFHVHPSLFRRGCTTESLQSKAAYSTLMMDHVAANGFKLIYFDQSNVISSGCQINNLNFNVARGVPNFEDHWLLPKKALGPKLQIEADVVKENIISVQQNGLNKRFTRLYKMLCCILAVAFHQLLLGTLFENAHATGSIMVKAADYILESMENANTIMADCVYYCKALRDVIRILKGGRQADNGNGSNNGSGNNSSDDGNNDNNNESGASTENNGDQAKGNNATLSSNEEALQQQPIPGIPYVPTRAESEVNVGPVTSHQPQPEQNEDSPTEADQDKPRITGLVSIASLPSSPPRIHYFTPTTINLSALFNVPRRLDTHIPSRPVLPDTPALNTAIGSPAEATTSGEATISTSTTDPVPNTANHTANVSQPTATLSTDHAPVGHSASQACQPVQATSTTSTEVAPIAQPTTDFNQPPEATSAPQVPTSAPAFPGAPKASSIHTARRDFGQKITTSLKGKEREVPFSYAKAPKGKGPEVKAPEVKDPKTFSFKATTAIPGRSIKPLPPRSRKFQGAKATSTASSSSQEVGTIPQSSFAPIVHLPAAESSSNPFEGRDSTPDFVVRKKRVRSAPVPSANPLLAVPISEKPITATTPPTLSQSEVDVSCTVPPPNYPFFSLSIDGPFMINFYQPIVTEISGSINAISHKVADITNAQLLQDDTSAPSVQHYQPRQQATTASNQYIQPDGPAQIPCQHQQHMEANDTQNLQQHPAQCTRIDPHAFNYYNQVKQQHPVAVGQCLQYATPSSNQTPTGEDGGLTEDIKAAMNDLFGNVRDADTRNINASDFSYSTMHQQQLPEQQLHKQQLNQQQQYQQEELRRWSHNQWQLHQKQRQQEQVHQQQVHQQQAHQQQAHQQQAHQQQLPEWLVNQDQLRQWQVHQQKLQQEELYQQQRSQQWPQQNVFQDGQYHSTFTQQPMNEDADMSTKPHQSYRENTMQDTGNDTMAYSMTLPRVNDTAHTMDPTMMATSVNAPMDPEMTRSMNSNMVNPMPEADSYHTATAMDNTTDSASFYLATSQALRPFYRSFTSEDVIEYRRYRKHYRQRWLLRPRAWRLRFRRKSKLYRKRRKLAAQLASALNRDQQAGNISAVTTPHTDMMPEVPSNAEAFAHGEAYIHGEEPNHTEEATQAEATTYAEAPSHSQASTHAKVSTYNEPCTSTSGFVLVAPPNVHLDPIPDEDFLIPGPDNDAIDPADLFEMLSMVIPRPPTPPRPRESKVYEPPASLTLFGSDSDDEVDTSSVISMHDSSNSSIDLGSRVISSPLTWNPYVENSEPTLDQLLGNLEIQPAVPNQSMARKAANYNFAADPPLPDSDSDLDSNSLEQQKPNNLLDGHGSEFSENSRDDNSSNEPTISGLADQDQTGNASIAPRLLITTRFSPPSQPRYPGLQDSFEEDDSVVNPAHIESNEMNDLISSAQRVSVDDETISTPSFFPSPSRPSSSCIDPSELVPPTNVKTVLPGFLTEGSYLSVTPPTGESSTQSSTYYGLTVPIRSAFDLRLHLPEDAYTRKRRYVEVDDAEEENESQVELDDSSNIEENKDDEGKRDKKKKR